MIFQVHALVPVPACEGVYSHHGHPVSMVEIMGVIQSVNRAIKYMSYIVDDGTGAIQCVMWIPDNYLMVQDTNSIQGLKAFSLGDVVRVKGYLEAFRDSIQIDVQPGCIVGCEDPNAETLFRLQVLNLERDVYSKPMELPNFVQEQFGVVTPLGKKEIIKGDGTKREAATKGNSTKGGATKGKATVEEATKEEATKEEVTKAEVTKAEVTKAEVTKEEVAKVEITERTLLDRLRAWVIGRKEFCILELMDDEMNKQMGAEVAKKRATSENLPAGSDDLALNLEICDQIRSKQVSPKDAAKALKRRIGHKNPNVQMLALGLTDVCVKNGGHHFLAEVAAREFIDNLTSILKAPAGCNLEVKNRILGLIQTWGLLFRGKHGLGYVCDTYMILQHEGFQFPPKDNVGAALVESEAPPDWTDSDVCTRCRSAFTLTNRKHHCRACGSTFCGQCSSKTMALPNMGVTQEVRVCDGCWMKKKLGPKSAVALESHGLGGGLEYIPSTAKTGTTAHNSTHSSSKPSGTTNSTSASRSAADDDADLLKAIELSLKESQTQAGYSAPKRTNTEPVKKAPVPTEEEEDADLLAAIEASLRETNIRSSSSAAAPRSSQRQSSYSSYTYSKKPIATVAVSQHELTETEKSNIEMFSVLVDRIQTMQGDVAGNREVQALYEQISKLQMKVALSLEEAARKQQEFVGFNDKIDHAVRIYDHLLQERLNSSYQRRMNATNYAQPGMYNNNAPMTPQTPQTSHIYPQMSNTDSRYAQYVPSSGPYGGTPSAQQTPQIPFQQAPYQQQQQPQQPQQPQQQPSYPYQTNQPPQSSGAPNAYDVTSPVASDQQSYSTAPAQQNQYGVQQQPQQPIQQQTQTQPQQQQFAPQYQSSVPQQYTNGSAAPAVTSPVVQSSVPANGQLPISNGYQPMGQTIQSPPPQQQQQQSFAPVAQQSAYVPYDPQQQQQQPLQQQQQQQQQPLQPQAPVIQPQFSGSAAPAQSQYAPYQQQQPQQQQQQAYAPIAQPTVEEAPLIEL
ncbi:Vacuolar protein-sorting-associated protein 27 [Mortierella sp. GBA39]|nr:Vacuolar protein-sorting-associated protein 27 [Mortierella sp. GBA39]